MWYNQNMKSTAENKPLVIKTYEGPKTIMHTSS